MVQQNYFQICMQQNFRSAKLFFPCNTSQLKLLVMLDFFFVFELLRDLATWRKSACAMIVTVENASRVLEGWEGWISRSST